LYHSTKTNLIQQYKTRSTFIFNNKTQPTFIFFTGQNAVHLHTGFALAQHSCDV